MEKAKKPVAQNKNLPLHRRRCVAFWRDREDEGIGDVSQRESEGYLKLKRTMENMDQEFRAERLRWWIDQGYNILPAIACNIPPPGTFPTNQQQHENHLSALNNCEIPGRDVKTEKTSAEDVIKHLLTAPKRTEWEEVQAERRREKRKHIEEKWLRMRKELKARIEYLDSVWKLDKKIENMPNKGLSRETNRALTTLFVPTHLFRFKITKKKFKTPFDRITEEQNSVTDTFKQLNTIDNIHFKQETNKCKINTDRREKNIEYPESSLFTNGGSIEKRERSLENPTHNQQNPTSEKNLQEQYSHSQEQQQKQKQGSHVHESFQNHFYLKEQALLSSADEENFKNDQTITGNKSQESHIQEKCSKVLGVPTAVINDRLEEIIDNVKTNMSENKNCEIEIMEPTIIKVTTNTKILKSGSTGELGRSIDKFQNENDSFLLPVTETTSEKQNIPQTGNEGTEEINQVSSLPILVDESLKGNKVQGFTLTQGPKETTHTTVIRRQEDEIFKKNDQTVSEEIVTSTSEDCNRGFSFFDSENRLQTLDKIRQKIEKPLFQQLNSLQEITRMANDRHNNEKGNSTTVSLSSDVHKVTEAETYDEISASYRALINRYVKRQHFTVAVEESLTECFELLEEMKIHPKEETAEIDSFLSSMRTTLIDALEQKREFRENENDFKDRLKVDVQLSDVKIDRVEAVSIQSLRENYLFLEERFIELQLYGDGLMRSMKTLHVKVKTIIHNSCFDKEKDSRNSPSSYKSNFTRQKLPNQHQPTISYREKPVCLPLVPSHVTKTKPHKPTVKIFSEKIPEFNVKSSGYGGNFIPKNLTTKPARKRNPVRVKIENPLPLLLTLRERNNNRDTEMQMRLLKPSTAYGIANNVMSQVLKDGKIQNSGSMTSSGIDSLGDSSEISIYSDSSLDSLSHSLSRSSCLEMRNQKNKSISIGDKNNTAIKWMDHRETLNTHEKTKYNHWEIRNKILNKPRISDVNVRDNFMEARTSCIKGASSRIPVLKQRPLNKLPKIDRNLKMIYKSSFAPVKAERSSNLRGKKFVILPPIYSEKTTSIGNDDTTICIEEQGGISKEQQQYEGEAIHTVDAKYESIRHDIK